MAKKVKVAGYSKEVTYNGNIQYRNFDPDLVGLQFAANGGTSLFTIGITHFSFSSLIVLTILMLILGFYPKTAICVCTLPVPIDKAIYYDRIRQL